MMHLMLDWGWIRIGVRVQCAGMLSTGRFSLDACRFRSLPLLARARVSCRAVRFGGYCLEGDER